jgi:superfamily II DNA or RNA helicase
MYLKEIKLKKAYSSDFDNILLDFYIPVLSHSVGYDRLAGFFSSSSLAIAARGISKLIKNNGIMRLVVSPKLRKDDLDTIILAHKDPEKLVEEKMLNELEKIEDEFIKNHVYALGWMVANKKLEIKVALICDEHGNPLSYEEGEKSGMFHQKVGILRDVEGNIVTFSGSINESAAGWLGNIEEFKVFRNWDTPEQDTFWNNLSKRVKVMKIPEAVEKKLIELAPKDIEKLDLEKWYPKVSGRRDKILLFGHQKEAVESWVKNGMRGIFEMATGTGKTFAALGCLVRTSETHKKLAVIITCPYQHLVQQWKREIDKFGITFDYIVADSSNPSWKDDLADSLVDISLGYKEKIIILTTHRTFSSNNLMSIVKEHKKDSCILLIADEVHGLGAERGRMGLIDEYDFRLGLSATPKRWFDFIGTQAIYNYFNDVVFDFNLNDAINTINPAIGRTYLTPYRYIPDYIEQSEKIVRRYHEAKTEKEKDEILERLYFKRANIIKNASQKYQALGGILDELPLEIKWCIIYCTPQQIDKVMEILNMRGIISHRFTMDEGTSPDSKLRGLSERDFILKKFAEGEYQVLVAMKCLDEGVDVPPARVAILMASSGNPREYIQRIGRVIRRYAGKSEATIYDVVVAPSLIHLPKQLRENEKKIFQRELKRYEEIAQIAINNAEAFSTVYKIKHKLIEG